MARVKDQQREIEQLRARVATLERQLADQAARANSAIARAQERTYWLDRWQLDLNELMRRPAIRRATAIAGALRRSSRWLRRVRGRPAGTG